MKNYKIAVLDDYQNVALESADWSVLRDRADIAVFQDHLADPDAVIPSQSQAHCLDGLWKRLDRCRRRGRSWDHSGSYGL